jgi:hypothetical protein
MRRQVLARANRFRVRTQASVAIPSVRAILHDDGVFRAGKDHGSQTPTLVVQVVLMESGVFRNLVPVDFPEPKGDAVNLALENEIEFEQALLVQGALFGAFHSGFLSK